jgi:TolB-like protein/tetratricopeptide (TPR) repeat protein
MATDDWQRVEDLFHRAADLPLADRPAFLDRVCGSDHDLRRELELLLDADAGDSSIVQNAVDRVLEQLPETEHSADLIGRRIGPYSITGLIGEGGMGNVYHAVREDDFRMPVAIKLVKRGAGSEIALRRFRTERQILAGLQHPHIARLLDGGDIGNGLPYLVMEYVEGAPLVEYAAALPRREVLKLFLAVCSAVHYAHQRRIVHRDIKPANILVTSDGIPKLLDFGIAKLLEPPAHSASSPTVAGATPMTPDYASPEQIRGQPVTVATDIYSLGAVLYELLMGRKFSALAQPPSIQTGAPRKLRDGPGRLDTDLNEIVLKALREEPGQRYASVEEFSADVQRYLHDLPVYAHANSMTYRARKFLKRQRLPTAAAAVAVSVAVFAAIGRLKTTVGNTDGVLRSVAVLPLENVSGDPGQDYFADGMTDALTAELARIHGLRVIARSSVMPFKGVPRQLPEIARSLRVRAIVEGSVARSGDHIRYTLQITDAGVDRPVWGGSFEGQFATVRALQDRAASAVAGRIRVILPTVGAQTSAARLNPDAYDSYLKARHALFRSTVEEIQRSIQLFQDALKIEPRYAPAYAGLAESYMTLSGMYLKPRQAMAKAKAAAERALEFDPDLPDAHTTMGVVQGWYEFSWDQSAREFKRALQLNPNSAMAHQWYGQSLIAVGRSAEGIEQIQIARDLDPLSAFVETGLGQMYFLSGQYALAIQQLRSVTASDIGFIEGHTWLGVAYLYTRQYRDAIRELERARQLDPNQPQSVAYLAYAHARLGETETAALLLRQLASVQRTQYVSPYLFAVVSAGMGKKDAVEWLEKAYVERDDMLAWLKTDAILEPVRGDLRYQRLLQQVGLASSTPISARTR